MSASIASMGYNMQAETFSKIASDVVNSGDSRSLECFLSRVNELHCDHLQYEITVSSMDLTRAIFISRISSAMPRLTRLVINAEVTNKLLNICLGDTLNLRHVTVKWTPDFDFNDINWRPRLYQIGFTHG